MKIHVFENVQALAEAAAPRSAALLNEAIAQRGCARLLLSTGMSQFEAVSALAGQPVDWSKVEIFHLDEYVALPESHPASFRRYIRQRVVEQLPCAPKAVHWVNGEGDVAANIAELSYAVRTAPIDVGLVGIGENGHIAFNDPPADFDTTAPYIVVNLDARCRAQQVGEGWFPTTDDVPKQAISMSCKQIMSCRTILSIVPHAVKAEAVHKTLSQPVGNTVPATLLKTHPAWELYLDVASAALCPPALLRV